MKILKKAQNLFLKKGGIIFISIGIFIFYNNLAIAFVSKEEASNLFTTYNSRIENNSISNNESNQAIWRTAVNNGLTLKKAMQTVKDLEGKTLTVVAQNTTYGQWRKENGQLIFTPGTNANIIDSKYRNYRTLLPTIVTQQHTSPTPVPTTTPVNSTSNTTTPPTPVPTTTPVIPAKNTTAASANIEFKNPVGVSSLTDFFENVMVKLGGIVAYLAVLAIVLGGIMYVISGMGGGNENMKKMAETTIVFAIIGLALTAAAPAFLKQIKIIVLGGVDASMPVGIGTAPTIGTIVMNTLTFLLSITGILAIISLVIGGIMYLMAGTMDVADRAGKTIKYSIIGIVTVSVAVMIVTQIVEFIEKK
jgi:hypothetical protein